MLHKYYEGNFFNDKLSDYVIMPIYIYEFIIHHTNLVSYDSLNQLEADKTYEISPENGIIIIYAPDKPKKIL